MPYEVDFNDLRGKGSFDLEIEKWEPLTVEYGHNYIGSLLFFFWRIKGTTHTFRISYPELMNSTQGQYEKHVAAFLKTFRLEYLGWANQGFGAPWMREYHEQYKNYIQP